MERKGGAVGSFPCQRWIPALYKLYLARETGIFFSSLDNPTSEEKQRESAAHFHVGFNIIASLWLSQQNA